MLLDGMVVPWSHQKGLRGQVQQEACVSPNVALKCMKRTNRIIFRLTKVAIQLVNVI